MKTIIKDRWLWSQVVLSQDLCKECGSKDSITIEKADIKKLIKILQKLDYKGIPKKKHLFGDDLEYEIGKEASWQKIPKRKVTQIKQITLNKRDNKGKKERMKGGKK